MKQLAVLFPALFAVFLVLSCATTDLAKKYPNMVANADPVYAGSIEAQFDRVFSTKLQKSKIEVTFHPRLNSVTLDFRYGIINYRQFWDAAARRQFAEALERYNADYTSKNLVLRYNKSRAVYGKAKGRVEWNSFRFSKTYASRPTIELGYRFRGDFPYFTTTMRSSKDESSSRSGSGNDSSVPESGHVSMYFTRVQADELTKLFDQEYLMGLLDKTVENVDTSSSVDDDY